MLYHTLTICSSLRTMDCYHGVGLWRDIPISSFLAQGANRASNRLDWMVISLSCRRVSVPQTKRDKLVQCVAFFVIWPTYFFGYQLWPDLGRWAHIASAPHPRSGLRPSPPEAPWRTFLPIAERRGYMRVADLANSRRKLAVSFAGAGTP